jgi:replicative DNA helicase
MSSRLPPQDIDAEQCVLGALLLGKASAVQDALGILKTEAFYQPSHGEIFEAVRALSLRGQAVDIVTLKDELFRRGTLEGVGGVGYLADLGEAVPTTANLAYYAEIVKRKAAARALIEIAGELAAGAFADAENPVVLIDRAEAKLMEIRAGSETQSKTFLLSEVLAEEFEMLDGRYHSRGPGAGLLTGFLALDYALTGLQPGELHVIAGRPGMGKTSLAMCLAMNVVANSKNALYISLEMNKVQVAQRIISAESGVSSHAIRTGNVTEADWQDLSSTIDRIWKHKLHLHVEPRISPESLRSVCGRIKGKHGLDVVIVDYLGLMNGERRAENRVAEISYITGALKALALDLEVPVIALAQLNRGTESRDNKRPGLADLRDSGSVEQDADAVWFVYRDSYYKPKEEQPKPGEDDDVEVILAKNRMGPCTTVRLGWSSETTKFFNLSDREELTP